PKSETNSKQQSENPKQSLANFWFRISALEFVSDFEIRASNFLGDGATRSQELHFVGRILGGSGGVSRPVRLLASCRTVRVVTVCSGKTFVRSGWCCPGGPSPRPSACLWPGW